MSADARNDAIRRFISEASDPEFLGGLSQEVVYELLDVISDLKSLDVDHVQFALTQLEELKSSLGSKHESSRDVAISHTSSTEISEFSRSYPSGNVAPDYEIDLNRLPQLSFGARSGQ